MSCYPKHLVIPDTQSRPGRDPRSLEWAGRYALEKRPDVIVLLGDHWDFPSLSDYETSTQKVAQARDVLADIEAGNEALRRFEAPIKAYNRAQTSRRRYRPRRVLLMGNHDGATNGGRVDRALQAQPWLKGFFDLHPMEAPGWEVIPFLQPITIDGVSYCHYFCRGANGHVTQSKRGMPSAKAQVIREGHSCTAGHRQGLDVHLQPMGGGRLARGVIAGSYYEGEESYLTPQGNAHWRGLLLKHEVVEGNYELCEVSLDYLERKFS